MAVPTVAVLGDLNNDLLLTIDAYPRIGGEALASGQVSQLGGSASNTAIALQRLGGQARLVSCVGQDAPGDVAVAVLGEIGVQTDAVVRHPSEPTSTNVVVITPEGDRTMFAYRGASAQLSASAIPSGVLDGVDWLHVSGYALLQEPQRSAALHVLALAGAAAVPISLDVPTVQWSEASETILEIVAELEVLVISEAGARSIAADARELLNAGCGMLALKRGAEGCRILTREEDVAVPAEPVTVVDTTGAGDSFAAAVILAVLYGADAATVGARANQAGARAASVRGAGQALLVG